MKKRSRALWLCLMLFVISITVLGQVNTASLTGLVSDPSGAVVAGAKVTAVNQATNVETTTVTNNAGYYTFASLPVGNYRVKIEAPGFRTEVSDVSLDLGQRARLDFNTEVGGPLPSPS